MGLIETVNGIMEDFNKQKDTSKIWKTLKKRLKKAGFKKEYKTLEYLDDLEAYNLLKVFEAIDKHLNKNNPWYFKYTKNTFKVIKALPELEDIEEVIKTLGDSGYEPTIKDAFTYAYLPEESLKIFKTLSKDKLYKKYDLTSKSLKKLGYKGVSSYFKSSSSVDMTQLDHIINIASLEGDAVGAIYVLATNGYKIRARGLNKSDFNSIKKITEEDQKEKSEGKGGIPVYLYDTRNMEIFQGYFISLKIEDKKLVLKSILECETEQEFREHNEIRDWLEKDYKRLIREVGFED